MIQGYLVATILYLLSGAEMPPYRTSGQIYTVNGKTIEVLLVPQKHTFLLGEPIRLTFTVKNLSNKESAMIIGAEPFSTSDRTGVRLQAMREDGLQVLPKEQRFFIGNVTQQIITLSPGKSESVSLFLPQMFKMSTLSSFSTSEKYSIRFRQPGRYTLTSHTELAFYDRGIQGNKEKKITTQASTNLVILSANREAMGKVIDDLGRTATTDTGKSEDVPEDIQKATDSLNAIEDSRVIPWAVKMFHMQKTYRKREAINILREFNSPAAFAILKAGLTVHDLRRDAVYALANSPYPKVLPLIGPLIHDPDTEVRQAIACVLIAKDPPDQKTLPLIETLIHDPDTEVRKAIVNTLIAKSTPAAIKLLRKMRQDPSPEVRERISAETSNPVIRVEMQ